MLKPLAEKLGIEKLNFQILRRTMATQAQRMGSVNDIQAHLRHARPDTTAYEYMQELPESVQEMGGSSTRCCRKEGPAFLNKYSRTANCLGRSVETKQLLVNV
jgi:hypothetical protein